MLNHTQSKREAQKKPREEEFNVEPFARRVHISFYNMFRVLDQLDIIIVLLENV